MQMEWAYNEKSNIANFEATDVWVHNFRAVRKFENSKIFVYWMVKFAIQQIFSIQILMVF